VTGDQMVGYITIGIAVALGMAKLSPSDFKEPANTIFALLCWPALLLVVPLAIVLGDWRPWRNH
jgi:hypothetical protein